MRRLRLPCGYHLSASADRKDGIRALLGFGKLGAWVLALLVGWNRWPHVSIGTVECRVGLGEWQTDAPGSVQGFGPFWFTRPPRPETP